MRSEKQEFFNQLLEASIRHHSTLEPRDGLQGRILAGVAARQQSAHKRAWALGLATAALAAIAIGVTARFVRQASLPAPHPSSVAVSRPQAATPPRAIAPERIPVKTVRISRVASQRPQQFPTPAPLSEQEKLLLLYVKETPKSVLAAPPEATVKELEIPALNIAAMEIKDLPGSRNEE